MSKKITRILDESKIGVSRLHEMYFRMGYTELRSVRQRAAQSVNY